MTVTPSPDTPPSTMMTDEEYGVLRAAAALWAGTSVVITDERGRILVQRVDYRTTCLLPGGAVDKNEPPAPGAARELREELGVTMTVDRGLAVDWVSADSLNAPASMRFPGEILHVYDGGTWDIEQIAAMQLPDREITSVEFVEPARLPDLMSPGDARRALSALRARINAAGPVLLENGLPIAPTVLDRAGALRTARARHHLPFHAGPAPEQLSVVQVWGWLLGPDGRALVLLEPDTGAALLPGGAPELLDRGDPLATLRREVREEASAEFGAPLFLGHLCDPDKPYARLRYAAPLTRLGPPSVDPATGRNHIRVLATPEQALELFDWGLPAADQLAAVHQARVRLGIPRAARQPLTELPVATDLTIL
ncbi:NUDIX domain-containing protein (plasmid) [Streptomyces sp. BB1-1-1]|uniref:NUDIX domain-containing protein n=1 Tax=Streptomyces sp. BB1-1-1 TaxID=3074430 RepID=UPI002877648C|nr:NUDIX domain-containing protein [Streptomyces sp. BB1-1-1]WND40753.1 NUDIX domain-containing protein [Streptomyces sp. BB1-1-1]